MKEVLLITTTTCPHCAEAKGWANIYLTNLKILVADADDHARNIAQKHNIQYVPAFIYKGQDYDFDTFRAMYADGKIK